MLEYRAEIDSGAWEEAEKLQVTAGRLALGVGRSVPEEVVRGDLGWVTVRGRREYLKLVYWGKVVREKGEGMVGNVYREGRRRVEQENGAGGWSRRGGARGWSRRGEQGGAGGGRASWYAQPPHHVPIINHIHRI